MQPLHHPQLFLRTSLLSPLSKLPPLGQSIDPVLQYSSPLPPCLGQPLRDGQETLRAHRVSQG